MSGAQKDRGSAARAGAAGSVPDPPAERTPDPGARFERRLLAVRAYRRPQGNLGLEVVAEGVETTGRLARLRELGCDLARGYHFAGPLPPEEIPPLQEEESVLR